MFPYKWQMQNKRTVRRTRVCHIFICRPVPRLYFLRSICAPALGSNFPIFHTSSTFGDRVHGALFGPIQVAIDEASLIPPKIGYGLQLEIPNAMDRFQIFPPAL